MSTAKKNILILEDDADLCELIHIILEKEGYQVQTLQKWNALRLDKLPDVIVLDVLFSDEDGRKICKQLKTATETAHIPILMYSAGTNIEETALAAGADDFISKPFLIQDLLEKIQNLL